MPLADIVENLFLDRGVSLALSRPDFSSIEKVPRDVGSRLAAGRRLLPDTPDVVVVHRDADNAGHGARSEEIRTAHEASLPKAALVPVIPIRMTEAWLLLDERAIRFVAGNPRGRDRLPLPRAHEVEGIADPKDLLQRCLLAAASVSGRRRQQFAARFSQNRRQLLERLDHDGPVTRLDGWQQMVTSIEAVIEGWSYVPTVSETPSEEQ